MAEPKVPLDTVIKHLSDTLKQQDSTIRNLETSLGSIRADLDARFSNISIANQADLDTRFSLIRSETQTEIQTLQNNLTSLLESKSAHWTQLSQDMQILTTGVRELKALMLHQHQTSSPIMDQTSPVNIPTTTHAQLDATSSPFVNAPNSVPYVFQQQNLPPSTTIVLPPTTSVPTFSGRPTEYPRQFLLRIEEYTRTVNQWSQETLLRGISQFLKDDALEWYCQLYHINAVPLDWNDFRRRFLAQFYSPIRVAQQEQAWIECKQTENETINQFIVRLRSLWLEQKPHEDESDFIKHLFCKMRPDMLNLMNFSRSCSLDAIIREAQKAEEILFLRNKEQRQRDVPRPKQSSNTNYFSSQPTFFPMSSKRKTNNISALMETPTHSRTPSQYTRPSPPSHLHAPRNSITCWRCYETGHYSTECPLNADTTSPTSTKPTTYENYSSQPLPPRHSKNN